MKKEVRYFAQDGENICLVLSELYSAGKAQNQICREFFCH